MNGWVWSNGGMILTGEAWSTGRKTLYSVGGRWMNEYGAMVEWYWQGKTEVLGEKHYTAWVVDEWMCMEQWWNGTDRGNWSAGRKALYSVGGGWMNEYGPMVEWYWQGKTEVLGETHVPVPHELTWYRTRVCAMRFQRLSERWHCPHDNYRNCLRTLISAVHCMQCSTYRVVQCSTCTGLQYMLSVATTRWPGSFFFEYSRSVQLLFHSVP